MGNAIARVGVDKAGGTITGTEQTSVMCNGNAVAVINDKVASHGSSPHASAKLTVGSSTVFAEGKRVCREGDSASCGHNISSGSGNVFAG